MRIKPGVRVHGMNPELMLVALAAEGIWKKYGDKEVVITSVIDGVHKRSSYHYGGQAVDLRTRNFSTENKEKAADNLRTALGDDYVVILESDHIHVHFQPREPY